MKKTISILLVLVLVFTLGACAKADPQADLMAAIEKTSALEYQDMTMNVSMEIMGMNVDVPITTRAIVKDEKIQAMEVSTETMGVSVNSVYVDDKLFVDASGMRMVCPITPEQFEEYSKQSGTGVEMDFEKDSIKSVEVAPEKDADGNTVYNVTLNEDKVKEFIDQVSKSLGEEGSVEATDFTYSVSVNGEGYAVKQAVGFNMKMAVEGITLSTDVEVTMAYNNVGKTFEIKAPEKAEEYTEMKYEELMG